MRDVPNTSGVKTFPPPGKIAVEDLKDDGSARLAAAFFKESIRWAAMIGMTIGFALLDAVCRQSSGRGSINVKERKLTLRVRTGVVSETQLR